ncbi:sel1 repeat family protein [Akkermansia massiliensis]
MKKLAYVVGLFALTCAPLLAALYENLEVGMDKDQVLKTLRQSKQLEGPPTDALLSRTGLNGVFKTKQPIGGQTFSLNFDYDPSGGLRAVVFYSRSKCRGSEYETKLKSAYKALLVGLTEKFGEPANMPEWVAKESLQEGRIQYMHMWRVSPGVFLMSGLGNMGAMEGYFPLFRFSGPSGMPPASKRDRDELKREWAAIPEFPGLKEAELHISDAVRAMGSKKYEDAFECFQQAAELGSPRGYWGMAFLYDLGKYGVKRDKKKRMKCTARPELPAMPLRLQIRSHVAGCGAGPGPVRRGSPGTIPHTPPGGGGRLCLGAIQPGRDVPDRLWTAQGYGQGPGMVPESGGPG